MADKSTEVLERINNHRNNVKWPPGMSQHSDLANKIDELINIAITRGFQLKQANQKLNLDQVKTEVRNHLSQQGNRNEILGAARAFKQVVEVHSDQHEQLKKIENAQGRRNLLWRAATTFTVASIIFFFYALAGCLGISMPLSRVAL